MISPGHLPSTGNYCLLDKLIIKAHILWAFFVVYPIFAETKTHEFVRVILHNQTSSNTI